MNKYFFCAIVVSVLIVAVAAQPLAEEGGVYVKSLSGIREKRAVTCRSVSSQPNNPGSYYEACRAHCVLNGKRGGSCSGGSCRCY